MSARSRLPRAALVAWVALSLSLMPQQARAASHFSTANYDDDALRQKLAVCVASLTITACFLASFTVRPCSPKYATSVRRTVSLALHVGASLSECFFGIFAFFIGDPHIPAAALAVSALVGQMPTALYHATFAGGDRALAIPFNVGFAALHAYFAASLLRDLGSLTLLLNTLIVLHAHPWSRIFEMVFARLPPLADPDSSRAAGILASTMLILPSVVGMASNIGVLGLFFAFGVVVGLYDRMRDRSIARNRRESSQALPPEAAGECHVSMTSLPSYSALEGERSSSNGAPERPPSSDTDCPDGGGGGDGGDGAHLPPPNAAHGDMSRGGGNGASNTTRAALTVSWRWPSFTWFSPKGKEKMGEEDESDPRARQVYDALLGDESGAVSLSLVHGLLVNWGAEPAAAQAYLCTFDHDATGVVDFGTFAKNMRSVWMLAHTRAFAGGTIADALNDAPSNFPIKKAPAVAAFDAPVEHDVIVPARPPRMGGQLHSSKRGGGGAGAVMVRAPPSVIDEENLASEAGCDAIHASTAPAPAKRRSMCVEWIAPPLSQIASGKRASSDVREDALLEQDACESGHVHEQPHDGDFDDLPRHHAPDGCGDACAMCPSTSIVAPPSSPTAAGESLFAADVADPLIVSVHENPAAGAWETSSVSSSTPSAASLSDHARDRAHEQAGGYERPSECHSLSIGDDIRRLLQKVTSADFFGNDVDDDGGDVLAPSHDATHPASPRTARYLSRVCGMVREERERMIARELAKSALRARPWPDEASSVRSSPPLRSPPVSRCVSPVPPFSRRGLRSRCGSYDSLTSSVLGIASDGVGCADFDSDEEACELVSVCSNSTFSGACVGGDGIILNMEAALSDFSEGPRSHLTDDTLSWARRTPLEDPFSDTSSETSSLYRCLEWGAASGEASKSASRTMCSDTSSLEEALDWNSVAMAASKALENGLPSPVSLETSLPRSLRGGSDSDATTEEADSLRVPSLSENESLEAGVQSSTDCAVCSCSAHWVGTSPVPHAVEGSIRAILDRSLTAQGLFRTGSRDGDNGADHFEFGDHFWMPASVTMTARGLDVTSPFGSVLGVAEFDALAKLRPTCARVQSPLAAPQPLYAPTVKTPSGLPWRPVTKLLSRMGVGPVRNRTHPAPTSTEV